MIDRGVPVLDSVDPVVVETLSRYSAAVDSLCSLDICGLSDTDLLALVQGMETQRRRLPVADHQVVAEVERRGVAQLAGYASSATLLSLLLRIDPGEARARVTAAAVLAPKVGLSGEVIGPVFPYVAAAQAAGVISEKHAALIRRTVDDLPLEVAYEHGAAAEKLLTEQAAILHPLDLGRVARRLADTLNPDGTLATETEQERRRYLRLIEHCDGTVKLDGLLTAVCAATLRPVLDSLSAPAPATTAPDSADPTTGTTDAGTTDAGTTVADPNADDPTSATGTVRDPRTAAMRAHDALETMAAMLLRSGKLPDSGGTSVTLLLTMTAQHAAAGTGYATTGHGALIPTRTALVLADSADVYTVICTATGGILDYGRNRRLASCTQRIALAARDRGCSFPGCTAPPSWTEAHHILRWLRGGETNLDNLCLLCSFHHRQVDREEWLCEISGGRPWWTPPKWLDREQTPLLNTAHHPPGVAGT